MKLYVIGDYGLDNYHVGRVRGLSAEAAIPVLTDIQVETLPAMAGNVVANLRGLGVDVTSIQSGSGQAPRGGCPVKHRLLTQDGQQLARWDEADTCQPYTVGELVGLRHADAVIVADYGKGSVTPELVEILSGLRVPLFVDTKQDPTGWAGSTAILFPNLAEFRQHETAYTWLPKVVLKLGAQGLAYMEYGKVILSRPAYARFAQCVNGAGDTVLAAFALAHLAGLPLPQVLEFASAAAALVVEQPPLKRTTGTFEVLEMLEELEDANSEIPPSNGSVDSGYPGTSHIRMDASDTPSITGGNTGSTCGCDALVATGDGSQLVEPGQEQLTFFFSYDPDRPVN